MIAPSAVSEDAFTRIGAMPKLYLEDGATGFGSVGDTWKGLLIAAGGTIITPDPEPDPAPVSSFPAPAPVPPVATEPLPASRSFSLDTPVLAKQQKKVLRTLVQEVGAKGSFEVVAGVIREPGQTKKQAKALALAKARAIKKYLVLRGVNKRNVVIQVDGYPAGEAVSTEVTAIGR
jgi:outer membrane protein OmpA-like peptidoglycan-associated protein